MQSTVCLSAALTGLVQEGATPALRHFWKTVEACCVFQLSIPTGLYEAELESNDGSVFYLRQVRSEPRCTRRLGCTAKQHTLQQAAEAALVLLACLLSAAVILRATHRPAMPCPAPPQEAPHALRFKTAEDICASPVVGFAPLERVSTVLQVLRDTTHSGFPVLVSSKGGYGSQRASLDSGGPGGQRGGFEGGSGEGMRDSLDGGGRTAGRLQGVVLRSQVGGRRAAMWHCSCIREQAYNFMAFRLTVSSCSC